MTEPFVETKASPKMVEEQIKAKATERILQIRQNPTMTSIEKGIITQWITYFVDDVLAVVNADRAEHNKQLQEPFAELAHQIWSEFIDYCLRIGAANGPEFQRKEVWQKWHNLARKRYVELTDREKESDRVIAKRYLELLKP